MTPSSEEVGGHGIDARRWLHALQRAADAAAAGSTLEVAAGDVLEEVRSAAGWPVGRLVMMAGEQVPSGVWALDDRGRFEALLRVADAHGRSPLVERAASLEQAVWAADVGGAGPVGEAAAGAGLHGAVAFPVRDDGGVI